MSYAPPKQFNGYPTPVTMPVANATTPFVLLLNKHQLPPTKFINDNLKIGIDDLLNLNQTRFVELCTFFQLNPIEKIRFEKLVNELNDGEDHFNSLQPSIDIYSNIITTSKKESIMIRSLDNEHQKMQTVSQIAEFMIDRTNNHSSICHEKINQIFDKLHAFLINLLNKKKELFHDNINIFKQKQLECIKQQLQNIDQYQCDIRSTRSACNVILESQPYGDDREDTVFQIVQSLLSLQGKHKSYRILTDLKSDLGEMSREIKIEYFPNKIETCIDDIILLNSIINDEMAVKMSNIENKFDIASHSQIIARPTRLLNANNVANSYSSSMYNLQDDNTNNINNINIDIPNNLPNIPQGSLSDIDINNVGSPGAANNVVNNNNNLNYNNVPIRAHSFSVGNYHLPNMNNMNNMQNKSINIIKPMKRRSFNGTYQQPSYDNNYQHNQSKSVAYPYYDTPQFNNGSSSNSNNNNIHLGNNVVSPLSLPHYSHSNINNPNNANNNSNNRSSFVTFNNSKSFSPVKNKNDPHLNHHNSSKSHGNAPILLNQSESNHDNDKDIQALLQEFGQSKEDPDIEDMFEPGTIDKTPMGNNIVIPPIPPIPPIPLVSNHKTDDIKNDKNKLSPYKENNYIMPNLMDDPIQFMKLHNQQEEKEEKLLQQHQPNKSDIPVAKLHQSKSANLPNIQSISINDNNNSIRNRARGTSYHSGVGSSPAVSRSRPLSLSGSLSSVYHPKWSVYGVGNNMNYELGLNHNNNINNFAQMDWEIDDSKVSRVIDVDHVIADNMDKVIDKIDDLQQMLNDEDDEKKEMIDDISLYMNTIRGSIGNGNKGLPTPPTQQQQPLIQQLIRRKVWNDCLNNVTSGPGWMMYLFDGGDLYLSGSNASGCFSIGEAAKGTYIKSLTQHSYFKKYNINIRYISSGLSGHHSFIITDNNDIYAMGDASQYQLALDDNTIAKNKTNYWPLKISYFSNLNQKVISIACGKKFSIFITESGATYSCGTNLFGALGYGDEINELKSPKIIENLKKVKATSVCCGENHVGILDSNHKVWTFGINNQGQLGRNAMILDYPQLVHISSRKLSTIMTGNGTKISRISSGCNHMAVVSSSGKLFVWGANDRYQLGDGTTKIRNKPKQLLKNQSIKDVECGSNHTVIITKKNKVYTWGCNEYNQCQQKTHLTQLQSNNNKNNSKKNKKEKTKKFKNKIIKPQIVTFQQPDIDQQIKKIYAARNTTFMAIDTTMEILRVCV